MVSPGLEPARGFVDALAQRARDQLRAVGLRRERAVGRAVRPTRVAPPLATGTKMFSRSCGFRSAIAASIDDADQNWSSARDARRTRSQAQVFQRIRNQLATDIASSTYAVTRMTDVGLRPEVQQAQRSVAGHRMPRTSNMSKRPDLRPSQEAGGAHASGGVRHAARRPVRDLDALARCRRTAPCGRRRCRRRARWRSRSSRPCARRCGPRARRPRRRQSFSPSAAAIVSPIFSAVPEGASTLCR